MKLTVEVMEDGAVILPDGRLLCVTRMFEDNAPTLERTTGILVEVRERRIHQDLMYGQDQNHSQETWHLIATHEMGEVATDLLLIQQGKEEIEGDDPTDHLRDEWLDVAATAVAAIERLDSVTSSEIGYDPLDFSRSRRGFIGVVGV